MFFTPFSLSPIRAFSHNFAIVSSPIFVFPSSPFNSSSVNDIDGSFIFPDFTNSNKVLNGIFSAIAYREFGHCSLK